ncbi:uncharacterized protein [Primulina huaijiensis]|uniref:uncharacterized protein isoform X1 n=1 Tax=Primulina huaijiensis TaxID=1492673 RepID=UPI003CC773C7
MEKSLHGSRRHDEVDFDLREWGLKRRISRENTNSIRFSASNLTSFREDATSFRSNITISSTTSSPGYTPREEIDPSTYSFTTALKALQAKTIYTWEYLSPNEGYTLNSKWSEAEKYISNPLSGTVPLECLSAKTLSGRSFRSLTSRITMSAPLIYPSMNLQQPHCSNSIEKEQEKKISVQERLKTITTRDIGTQSTLVGLRSRSPSPIPTPSIEERSIKKSENEGGDSSVSSGKFTPDKEVEVQKTKEDGEFAQKNEGKEDRPDKARKKASTCSCFSLITRKRSKSKTTKNTTTLHFIKACYV